MFCPFCHASPMDGCEHVLASYTDGGWNYRPFDELPLPEVPEDLEGAEPTDEGWRECFGDLAEVVQEVYAAGDALGWKPELEDEPTLFVALLEAAGLAPNESSWHVNGFYTSSAGTDWFVRDRAAAFEALRLQGAELHAGFGPMVSMLRDTGPRSTRSGA